MFQTLRDRATQAVAGIDTSTLRAKVTKMADGARRTAGEAYSAAGERLTHPADAYDQGIDAVVDEFFRRGESEKEFSIDVTDLKTHNPYR